MWEQSFPTLTGDIKSGIVFNYRANSYVGMLTEEQQENVRNLEERGKDLDTKVIAVITLQVLGGWRDYYICLRNHFFPHILKNGSWYFEGIVVDSSTGQLIREGQINLIEMHGKFRVVE